MKMNDIFVTLDKDKFKKGYKSTVRNQISMNNSILFFKSVLYPYFSPIKTKLCILWLELLYRSSSMEMSKQETTSLLLTLFPFSLGDGCHEIQEPAGLCWSPRFPNNGTWCSTDEPQGGDCLDHRTGTEEKWGIRFPLWVQNHSNSWQADTRLLVIHLRLRMFSKGY